MPKWHLVSVLYFVSMPFLVLFPLFGRMSGIEFAATTAVLCGFSYFVCAQVAINVLEFGTEIDIVSLHRFQKLWRLSVRYDRFPLTMILILTPVLTAIVAFSSADNQPFQNLMIAFDLFLLQILFCLIALMNRVGAVPRLLREFLLYAIFPFRFLGYVLRAGLFGIWLSCFLWKLLWDLGAGQFFALLDTALSSLLHITGLGPLIVYLINPFYLMLYVFRDGPNPLDLSLLIYFAGATAIISAALATRLYNVLWGNWADGRTEAYNQWLDIREHVLHDIIAIAPPGQAEPGAHTAAEEINTPFSPASKNEPLQQEDMAIDDPSEELQDKPDENIARTDCPDQQFILPAEMTGEEFIDSLNRKATLLNRTEVIVLLIAIALLPVLGLYWYIAVVLLWFVLSAGDAIPLNYHSWITPQNVWRYVRITIRRSLPFWIGDLVMAAIACWILSLHILDVIIIVISYISFRFMVLACKIAYKAQFMMTLIFTCLVSTVYTMMLADAMNTDMSSIENVYICVIGIALCAIVWLILIWRMWASRCNLLHYLIRDN